MVSRKRRTGSSSKSEVIKGVTHPITHEQDLVADSRAPKHMLGRFVMYGAPITLPTSSSTSGDRPDNTIVRRKLAGGSQQEVEEQAVVLNLARSIELVDNARPSDPGRCALSTKALPPHHRRTSELPLHD